MVKQFVVLVGRVWSNKDGFGITHSFDGKKFRTNAAAIRHGFKTTSSDDFNVGLLENGNLVDILWMEESRRDSLEDINKVAKEVGLWLGL